MLGMFVLFAAMFVAGCLVLYSALRVHSLVIERRNGRLLGIYNEKLFGLFTLNSQRLDGIKLARNEPFFDQPRNSVVMLDGESGSLQVTPTHAHSSNTHWA